MNTPTIRRRDLASLSSVEVEDLVADMQSVQKSNAPASHEWQQASAELRVLYAEMCARDAGRGAP